MKHDPSGYWRTIGIKGDAPGHPFRGNQYTDRQGQEYDPNALMFHGTAAANLESILKDGIKAGGQGNYDSTFTQGTRGDKVFLSTLPHAAQVFGKNAAYAMYERMKGEGADARNLGVAILRVIIPPNVKLQQDRSVYDSYDAYMLKEVKPEWIVGYDLYKYDPDKDTLTQLDYNKPAPPMKQAGGVMYVPIVVSIN